MVRKLGFAALILTLAGPLLTAEETQPPPKAKESKPTKPIRVTVRATLDALRIPDRNETPDRTAVALKFLRARPRQTVGGEDERSLDAIKLTCAGVVTHELERLQRGLRFCLYAEPKSPSFELCDLHRWHLSKDPTCDRPTSEDPLLICTAVDGPCEEREDADTEEAAAKTERKSYLWSGPTVQEMAESQAPNLRFDTGDAVGGYMLIGGILIGREPRAAAVGDLNGDDQPDLVVALAGELSVVAYLADPDGKLEKSSSLELKRGACALTLGEFGGEPSADLAVAFCGTPDEPYDAWALLLGDGKGTFAPGEPSRKPVKLTIGDFNGDGANDIIVRAGKDELQQFFMSGAEKGPGD